MPTKEPDRPIFKRIATGVPGLDTVLRGGIVIIQGSPGAGKTILGNQMCFHHVAAGGSALSVTLLAENHARMLLHIGQLGFFEEAIIPDRLYYIGAFRVLEQEGLPAVLNLLRREVQARGASILVLDGCRPSKRPRPRAESSRSTTGFARYAANSHPFGSIVSPIRSTLPSLNMKRTTRLSPPPARSTLAGRWTPRPAVSPHWASSRKRCWSTNFGATDRIAAAPSRRDRHSPNARRRGWSRLRTTAKRA
jgi:hypothetical protein